MKTSVILASALTLMTLSACGPTTSPVVEEPTDPEPTETQALRELAEERNLLIGAALQADPLKNEPAYAEIAGREFNLLFPEGSFLISEMHTPEDPYSLSHDMTDLDNHRGLRRGAWRRGSRLSPRVVFRGELGSVAQRHHP